jgi:putative flippase GtrA
MIARATLNKYRRYAVVGVLGLGVYLLAGQALAAAGATATAIAALSFLAAIAFNYVLQKVWVFADVRPIAASLPKYTVMTALGFVINIVAIRLLVPVMPLVAAQLASAALVVLSNALFAFLWVFAAKSYSSAG